MDWIKRKIFSFYFQTSPFDYVFSHFCKHQLYTRGSCIHCILRTVKKKSASLHFMNYSDMSAEVLLAVLIVLYFFFMFFWQVLW